MPAGAPVTLVVAVKRPYQTTFRTNILKEFKMIKKENIVRFFGTLVYLEIAFRAKIDWSE